MMYEDVIRDFAERTRLNLRAIERLETDGHDVYEVTRLVNSTLGLLVFPQQEFVDRIPETPLTELVRDGWPVPTVRRGADRVNNLNQLIRYLRNAIAHFNIQFRRRRSKRSTCVASLERESERRQNMGS